MYELANVFASDLRIFKCTALCKLTYTKNLNIGKQINLQIDGQMSTRKDKQMNIRAFTHRAVLTG